MPLWPWPVLTGGSVLLAFKRGVSYNVTHYITTEHHPRRALESAGVPRWNAVITAPTAQLRTILQEAVAGWISSVIVQKVHSILKIKAKFSRAVFLELLSVEHRNPMWAWALPTCCPINFGKAGFLYCRVSQSLELRATTTDILLVLQKSLCFCPFASSISQMRRWGSERLL